MTRNLKTLGLALLAAFALSAVAASTASAVVDTLTSTSANDETVLTGKTDSGFYPTLSRGGSTVVCNQGTYAGTVNDDAVTSVAVHPIYEEDCTVAGEPATVETDGCDFVFTGTTDVSHAIFSIECTAGSEITVLVASLGITLHVPSQANLSGVKYTNLPSHAGGAGMTVNATVTGITSTCTGTKITCFFIGGAHAANAGYTERVEVTGYEDNCGVVQDSTTHEWSGIHAKQVGISVD